MQFHNNTVLCAERPQGHGPEEQASPTQEPATAQIYTSHFTPMPGGFDSCSQNLKSFNHKDFKSCQDKKSEPEIWLGLIAEWCDRRDKPRLKECLDGLRSDGTIGEAQRREIWRGLSQECRVMCQAIAGGAE